MRTSIMQPRPGARAGSLTHAARPDRLPTCPLPTVEVRVARRLLTYTIRESARARWISASVRPETGVVVTVPRSARRDEVARFVLRHRGWMLKQANRLASLASRIPCRWPYGPTLPYLGREHHVVIEPGDSSRVEGLREGRLIVRVASPTIPAARLALKRWYMAEALRWCTVSAATLARQLGISYRRLTVRDQRTRWGSCSTSGALSFNYRLVMAPLVVLEYVVLHELCHRIELSHSRAFWRLVSAHRPSYREAIAWLRTDGPYLGV